MAGISVSGVQLWLLLGLLVTLSTDLVLLIHNFARTQRLAALRQRAQQVLEPGAEVTRSLAAEVGRLTQERGTQSAAAGRQAERDIYDCRSGILRRTNPCLYPCAGTSGCSWT
jgi:membrane protein implicated in regulation of membrane protease activity